MGKTGIRNAYRTGRGKIYVRAKAEIEEYKDGRFRIAVTEIPYGVRKSALIEKIAEEVKGERIFGISDIRDESDKDGLRFVIELKREANPPGCLKPALQVHRHAGYLLGDNDCACQ